MRECCLLFNPSPRSSHLYMLLLNPFRVGFGMEAFWLFILSPSGFLCIIANCPRSDERRVGKYSSPLRSLPSSLRPLRETFLSLLLPCLLPTLKNECMRECYLLFKTSATYNQIYMLLLNPFRVGFGMEAFWLFILSPSGFLCIIANCPL